MFNTLGERLGIVEWQFSRRVFPQQNLVAIGDHIELDDAAYIAQTAGPIDDVLVRPISSLGPSDDMQTLARRTRVQFSDAPEYGQTSPPIFTEQFNPVTEEEWRAAHGSHEIRLGTFSDDEAVEASAVEIDTEHCVTCDVTYVIRERVVRSKVIST